VNPYLVPYVFPGLKYLFVACTSFAYWQWISIYLLASGIGKQKGPIRTVMDDNLLAIIKTKTGLRLGKIRVSASTKLWGMMVGLPGHPYMILSDALYRDFGENEKEYVILHETGHYLLAHSAKLAAAYLCTMAVAFFVIAQSSHSLVWIMVSWLSGVALIQVSRVFEYQADAFALTRITDPRGIITATRKFEHKSVFPSLIRLDEDTLLGRLIYISIPYNIRIRNAEEEMKRRNQNK